jgi:nickel-type superoxide dismutase maturation protease
VSVTRPRTAIVVAIGAWAATWLVNRSLVAVRGPSMLPTLAEGELLVTVPRRLARLRVGRVVVVEDPAEAGHLIVKRVARIDAGGVLVLGDHAAASTDGRVWGPLEPRAVRRVAVARWPSLARAGLTAGPPGSGNPDGREAQPGRRASSSSSGSSTPTSPSARRP